MPSMGSGAADGLQQVLQRLFAEAQLQQRAQMEQARLAEDARQADQGFTLGQGQLGQGQQRIDLGRDELGLSRDKLGFEQDQYAGEAPLRDADVAYKGALTGELVRKPAAEEAERSFTLGRDKTLHGYELGEIGASGAEQRRTLSMRQEGTSPQRDAAQDYTTERATRTRQSVDELIGKVSNWTTGVGSVLSNIPATDARNFAAELATLKANIAFGELTEMRNASKTGGALGQVSNIELQLLESTLGALDAGQSPGNLKAQLAKIRGSLDRWENAKAQGGAVRVNPANLGGTAPQMKQDPLGIR